MKLTNKQAAAVSVLREEGLNVMADLAAASWRKGEMVALDLTLTLPSRIVRPIAEGNADNMLRGDR